MSLAERQIWVDGKLGSWEQAQLHIFSQSAQRGYVAFDVLSCHWLPSGPKVFRLRAHLERLLRSAELAGMRVRLDLDGLLDAVGQTVPANPGATQLKVCAYYPGVSADVLPREPFASVAVAAYSPQDLGAGGGAPAPLRVQIADALKLPADVLSPQAKLAGSYTYSTIAKVRARAQGFDDVLLLDRDGNIAEGVTTSFFWVEGDGTLCTAPLDVVLSGVTRASLIELARDEGIAVREVGAPAARLREAAEAFMASTTLPLRAVAAIDERALPQPVPGPITARLAERLRRVQAGEDARFSGLWLEAV